MHDFHQVQLHQLWTNYHELRSTFTQEAPWSFRSSVHTLFYPSALCSLNFILLVLVSLLRFDRTCVQLQTQLRLYFSSVSASDPICTLASIFKLVDTPCFTLVRISTKIPLLASTKITPLCFYLSLWLYSDLRPLILCPNFRTQLWQGHTTQGEAEVLSVMP